MTKAVTNRNSDAVLATCMGMFIFMALYPVVEYNISCPMAATDPDGNESCIWAKGMLWEAIVIMSLGLEGDGAALSGGADEQHSRNIVPVLISIIVILFYQKSKT